MTKFITVLLFTLLFAGSAAGQQPASCHLKNPLCFYGTDILAYLQAMHQAMQYEKILPYLTGPAVDEMERQDVIRWLSGLDWAYTFRRAGIREIEKGKWVINYKRSRQPYDDSFKVTCVMKNGFCRLWLDAKTIAALFPAP
jgi:hypothetical protein